MNLNEECLLQFLQNDRALSRTDIPVASPQAAGLSGELKRIFRRERYVSFPQAILIRRPES